MNVPENCIERKRHPVPIGWILVPSNNQRKWAVWKGTISWTVWKGTCFETDGSRELEFLENFHCSSCSFPLPTVNCQGASWTHYSFLRTQRKAISCVFQVPHEVCLQSKASFAKLTNDGFCFSSAWGSREWALCIYQSTWSFPSSYPQGPLPVLGKKSVGLVQWPPLGQTQSWKPLCAHFLKYVEGKMFQSRAAVGLSSNISVGCLFFWIFTKELLPEDLCTPAHTTTRPPHCKNT